MSPTIYLPNEKAPFSQSSESRRGIDMSNEEFANSCMFDNNGNNNNNNVCFEYQESTFANCYEPAQQQFEYDWTYYSNNNVHVVGEVTTTTVESGDKPSKSNNSIQKPKKRKPKSSAVVKKSTYKHVPHSEKPAHLVAKRNARERRRVHAVNLAFVRLRKALPFDNKRGKRISKVRVLQKAIDYIQGLREAVAEFDNEENQNFQVFSIEDDARLFAF